MHCYDRQPVITAHMPIQPAIWGHDQLGTAYSNFIIAFNIRQLTPRGFQNGRIPIQYARRRARQPCPATVSQPEPWSSTSWRAVTCRPQPAAKVCGALVRLGDRAGLGTVHLQWAGDFYRQESR